MNINPAFQRMIIDTFLKNHREAILDNVNNAVAIVEGFNDRFTAVERKIDMIMDRMSREELNDEILDVLEDLRGEAGTDGVVDTPDLPVDNDAPDFVEASKDNGDMPNG